MTKFWFYLVADLVFFLVGAIATFFVDPVVAILVLAFYMSEQMARKAREEAAKLQAELDSYK